MQNTKPRLWTGLFERTPDTGLGLREQLCLLLRQSIRDGSLAVDERLPSTRVLAQDLAISRVTVEAAYSQLETEGYLRRQLGQGSFVAIAMHGLPTRPTKMQARSPSHAAHASAALSSRGQRMLATGGCMEPLQLQAFAAGGPDLKAFPMDVWRQLLSRRLRTDSDKLMRYGDPQGHSDLRTAIAQYLAPARGVNGGADRVLVLTSSQQALQLLATVLLDESDVVWMEDPGYAGARTAFTGAGAHIVNMSVDDQGAVLDNMLPVPRLIYLTPSHQFPTGNTLALQRRLAFIAFAKRHGAWILEDDYDSEFHFDGRPTPALQGLDHDGRVIYIGTFSKALFPSLRLAYVMLPPELVQALVISRSIFDGHTPQMLQAVTADFIARGHFAAHLRLMRQLYSSRRDVLRDAVHRHVPWAQPLPSAGGLQLCVRLPPGTETRLSQQAAGLGVATPSLSALYQDRQCIDGWRLGYSALQPSDIVVNAKLLGTLRPAKKPLRGTPLTTPHATTR